MTDYKKLELKLADIAREVLREVYTAQIKGDQKTEDKMRRLADELTQVALMLRERNELDSIAKCKRRI